MGTIGPDARDILRSGGHDVSLVDFPQNTFRDEWGYRRGLWKALQACSPEAVVPVGNMIAASRSRDLIPEGVLLPVDTEDRIRLLDSKTGASEIASRTGVPQPRFFKTPEEAGTIQTIFKRDKSFGGSGVLKPKNMESLRRLVEHEGARPYLIEEFIEGEDWSVDCVRAAGEFRASCYRSLGNQGQGPAKCRVVEQMPLLLEYSQRILDAVEFRGVCGMDFRVAESGEAYFLECNPRLTGGVKTQYEAGFNIPELLLKLF